MTKQEIHLWTIGDLRPGRGAFKNTLILQNEGGVKFPRMIGSSGFLDIDGQSLCDNRNYYANSVANITPLTIFRANKKTFNNGTIKVVKQK